MVKQRHRWGRRIEFFLTSVGYSVGVGDLWRFPYLVMRNGGGAFLIPIVIFNILGAIPIVYLEMIMGQYSQSGAIPVWNVCPLLKGVGYGTLVATFLFAIYYAVIICWMLYYFIHSFFNPLPWATCDNEWNTKDACVVSKTATGNFAANVTTMVDNVTSTVATSVSSMVSFMSSATNSTTLLTTKLTAGPTVQQSTAAEEFWKYKAHRMTSGLEDLGDMNWPLFGCLAAIEVFCFLCIFKGVKTSGKVVYFTVLGPFVLLAVFLVRGAILPGAEKGILFYVTPKVEKLRDIKIWAEACMQVFISVGPGLGGMITFASYNKFTNNCMKDAILVCLMDLLTGFIGGFVIFSVIGHLSYKTGIPIENFNQSGYGLGFIAYPEAANYLPPPQLWCALFFFMSIFLGIDSQFPSFEIVVTAFRDEFPKIFSGKKTLLTLIAIGVAFVLAIPQVTQGGIYLLTLVDWYAATFSVTVFALIEVLVMTYVYGLRNVEANMKEMTGFGIPLIFKICWIFCTPVLLAVTLGFAIFTYAPPAYGDYVYPPWSIGLGWVIAITSLVPIPVYLVYRLYKTPGTILERFRVNIRPNEKWGPGKNLEQELEMETEVVASMEKNNTGIWNTQINDSHGADNKSFENAEPKQFLHQTRL